MVHYYIEKDLNGKQEFFPFTICGFLLSLTFFGSTMMSVYGVMLGNVAEIGWTRMLIQAYVFPAPFLLILYLRVFPTFRELMRPYVEEQNSNVVYLKPRTYRRIQKQEKEN